MEIFKKIPWHHEGKDYELRIMFKTDMINVAAFLNNYPVNGFRYQIILPKQINVEHVLKEENFISLIENAKADIQAKRWEKIVS